MLFNSQIFLLTFLPVALAVYWAGARCFRPSNPVFRIVLLAASIIFYGYWDIRLLPLLITSIIVNYVLIESIRKQASGSNIYLAAGVTANLLVLGFFKYFNFFSETLSQITGSDFERFSIILPLGISFFTFQQISALVDAAKRQLHPHSFLDYALYVSFFPQLIAGPIVRHDQLVPQLQTAPDRTDIDTKFAEGLFLLTFGLAKKVLVADPLAAIADPLFNASLTGGLSGLDAWTAAFAFGFQIYFDFSGYTDMAIGIALLFGVRLPINFISPYRATSLVDFWHRWHITLSTFLRDYLYIPLGGNRHGPRRRAVALMSTMLLGGLWHGAGWNFVIWGALHGAALSLNHWWRNKELHLPRPAAWVLTFIFVIIAFLIFRAENSASVRNLLTSLAGLSSAPSETLTEFNIELMAVFATAVVFSIIVSEPTRLIRYSVWKNKYAAFLAALIFSAIVLYLGEIQEQEFIYFQF